MIRFPGIRRVVLCGCVLVLGGCVHTTKPVFVRHYDLGAATPAISNSGLEPNRGVKVLQISRIAIPPWLEGTAMHYRLDYSDERRLAAYGRSDWIAPPATLLEPIIQNTIAAAGDWRAVTGPRNPATADASLHIRLDDFSQTFSEVHDSAGVIDATATLIDNHDDSAIAQRHFHVEVAAPTPDAQGGVKALRDASLKLAADLQRWLQQSPTGQAAPEGTPIGHATACR